MADKISLGYFATLLTVVVVVCILGTSFVLAGLGFVPGSVIYISGEQGTSAGMVTVYVIAAEEQPTESNESTAVGNVGVNVINPNEEGGKVSG